MTELTSTGDVMIAAKQVIGFGAEESIPLFQILSNSLKLGFSGRPK